jgi:hypothetical protein
MRPGTSNPTALLVFPEGFRLFAERDNFFDLCFAFPGAEETIKKDVQFIALSTASKTARRFYIFTWMNWGYSSGVRGYLRR